MRLSVFCLVLCLGEVILARPEGETSAVANPAPAEGEAAPEDPKPAEQVPPEEDEAARSKRWYYYYPNYPYSLGYGYPWSYNNFGHFRSGGGPTGRTGSTPHVASFEELMAHNQFNEFDQHQQLMFNQHQQQMFNHQQQQWMNNQQNFNNHQQFNNLHNRPNLPDVIDTASPAAADAATQESRTRFPAISPINNFNNYPHNNFNGPFNPNFPQGPFPFHNNPQWSG